MTDAKATAPLTRRDIEAKIVALAWQDDDFRRKFVADPKGQFEQRLGTKLPASLKMTVHEENENNLHFVIPTKPKSAAELSDEELEKVAGGTDLVTTLTVVVASIVSAGVGGATTSAILGATIGGW
jgi:Nitrile hydratase, alpha chain